MPKKKTQSKSNIFFRIILALNILFVCMILIAIISPYVNPEHNYIPAFFGLGYPLLLYANIAFVIFWVLFGKKWFAISLIAILLGFNLIQKFYQWNFDSNKKPNDSETFTIVSYNVQSFGTFYHHGSLEYLDSLMAFFHEREPDIICFQEFYNDLKMEPTDISGMIENRLSLKYKNIHSRLIRWDRYQFGLAIFSKFPVIHTDKILNSNYDNEIYTTNFAVFSDMIIYGDTFRVYNVHLESLKISEEDEIIQLIEEGRTDNFTKDTKKFFAKLKNAFIFRAKQIQPIREHMDASPYPIIVCGDFNDTPSSWAYRQMSRGLNDAFVEAGKGTGKTYNGRYPSLRIDYILTAPSIKVHWFETPRVEFSDHFPVVAVCSIKK